MGHQFDLAVRQLLRAIPAGHVTDIRPDRMGASHSGTTKAAFLIIAEIVVIALVIGYAGYCFYTTAEKINKTRDKFRIGLPRLFASFELPSRKARKSAVTHSGDQRVARCELWKILLQLALRIMDSAAA
jgi:hypothetical protein